VDWTDESKQAVSRVPFFVRKRVKKRVEEEAGRFGAKTVTLLDASRCLTCGQCIRVCPTGTLSEGKKG